MIIGGSGYVDSIRPSCRPEADVEQGQVEAELIGHARENSAAFESYILRPGFVLGKEFSLRDVARSLTSSVELDAVAKVTVDVSLNGFSGDTLENGDIVQRGNAVVTSP